MTEETLQLARLRNDFYRDNFRRVVGVLLFSLVLNVVFSVIASWLFLTRPAPVYYATSTDGKLIQMIPLDQPFVKNDQVLSFTTQAAIATTSFDFLNYEANLSDAKTYFTTDGFNSFLNALNSSGNLDRVKEQDLVAKGIVTGVPTIVQQGVIFGHRYSWKVEVPMTIQFESASAKFTRDVLVTLIVSRVSTAETALGIQIMQYTLVERASELQR